MKPSTTLGHETVCGRIPRRLSAGPHFQPFPIIGNLRLQKYTSIPPSYASSSKGINVKYIFGSYKVLYPDSGGVSTILLEHWCDRCPLRNAQKELVLGVRIGTTWTTDPPTPWIAPASYVEFSVLGIKVRNVWVVGTAGPFTQPQAHPRSNAFERIRKTGLYCCESDPINVLLTFKGLADNILGVLYSFTWTRKRRKCAC